VELGPAVERGAGCTPYERAAGDPLYRPLRIYALDPSVSVLDGAVALVNVPFEEVKPGPVGSLFAVDDRDDSAGVRYRAVDLDSPRVLIGNGLDPSPSDPLFHQQMVYAVCSTVYATFRHALGRHVEWGFGPGAGHEGRLRVRPHARQERNAFYDKVAGELCFGYYRADDEVAGRSLPGGFTFTCLSHDVVAHEVTHALLDGLRARFTYPSGPDVLAFHEGFADLVALFQHFTYPRVVEAAVARSRSRLGQAELLTGLAREFGHTTAGDRATRPGGALRSAIRLDGEGKVVAERYDPGAEPHALGSVLVSAAFDAFLTVYERKTSRYLRLATGGTGVLPEGDLPAELRTMLAGEASKLAGHFLTVCIRAVDYCPPVDLELGEFLRAVVTADRDLVPDDSWGYREAWVDAFARRGIYPPQVRSLAEDALVWESPAEGCIPPEPRLSFAKLRFRGDPGNAAAPLELKRQARAVGRMVLASPEIYGMVRAGDPRLCGDEVDAPVVHSVRSSRRVGPDGQVVFDLVAEVTQRRRVQGRWDFHGGATLILDPRGAVRYTIVKNILSDRRMKRQEEFMGGGGALYWTQADGRLRPRASLFRMLHSPTGDQPADASSAGERPRRVNRS
jgi:hypothetical protein